MWLIRDESTRDTSFLKDCHDSLNEKESHNQRRFYFERDRHQYLVAHGALRRILSYYEVGVSPEQWRFEENNYGRPYISNASIEGRLYFNLSHTRGLIAIAVSRRESIGVDVEWVLREGKNVEIADSFFSPEEAESLRRLPTGKQQERFFVLWTLKESYIKACGKGLSIPLDSFSFGLLDGDIRFSTEREDDAEDWIFWTGQPYPNYRLSLAIGENRSQKSAYQIKTYELVEGRCHESGCLKLYPTAY